jgi:hypothetical protein
MRCSVLTSALIMIFPLATVTAQREIKIPSGRVVLGQGFNPLTDELLSPCVDPVNSDAPGIALSSDFSLVNVKSTEELRKEFSLTAAASLGFGPFAASAKHSEWRSQETNSFSNFLVVNANVEAPSKGAANFVLNPRGTAALAAGNTTFVQRCGMEYVTEVTEGGSFQAVARFTSESQREQSYTSTAADVSVGMWASGKASWSDAMKRVNTNSTRTLRILTRGRADAVPGFDQIEAYAQAFPQTLTNPANRWTISARTAAYTTADFGAHAAPSFDLTDALGFINDAAGTYSGLVTELADLNFVRRRQGQFLNVNSDQIANRITAVQHEQARVLLAARNCINAFATRCANIADAQSSLPAYTMPTRIITRFETSASFCMQQAGGPGIRAWIFDDNGTLRFRRVHEGAADTAVVDDVPYVTEGGGQWTMKPEVQGGVYGFRHSSSYGAGAHWDSIAGIVPCGAPSTIGYTRTMRYEEDLRGGYRWR